MPKLTGKMRGPGVEPGPLAGGDFKSVPCTLQDNNLAHVPPMGSGGKRQGAARNGGILATSSVTTAILTIAAILGARRAA